MNMIKRMPVRNVVMCGALFEDEYYKDLSVDAKVLYSLLLDRMQTYSVINDWCDPYGEFYVIFPRSELMGIMNASRHRVDKALKELIYDGELVAIVIPEPGKPRHIYVRDISEEYDETRWMELEFKRNLMNISSGMM